MHAAPRLVHLQVAARLCLVGNVGLFKGPELGAQNKDIVGLSESLFIPVQLDKSQLSTAPVGPQALLSQGRALKILPPAGVHSEAQSDGPNCTCLDQPQGLPGVTDLESLYPVP